MFFLLFLVFNYFLAQSRARVFTQERDDADDASESPQLETSS